MVPTGRPLPEAEARAQLARLIRTHAGTLAALAVVLRGDGFWASGVRGLLTAIAMLSPRDSKLRIVASFDDVTAWLPELHLARTGVRLPAAALIDALRAAEQSAGRDAE
jgi:hypothetical protein